MKIDRTTKTLLAIIALGLWLNIINPTAKAQDGFTYSDPATRYLDSISHDIHGIWLGQCPNSMLCPTVVNDDPDQAYKVTNRVGPVFAPTNKH